MSSHTTANYASAFFAILAAVLWFCSALVKIPDMTYQEAKDNPMHIALRSAAKLNAGAALCAGVAAIPQAVAGVTS
jgi:hypothetical protein